tara:strand:+ start:170 stop:367 length:198 start_codon:yes stop_codon:yes gene_type:complete
LIIWPPSANLCRGKGRPVTKPESSLTITARYAHIADDPARAAADRIAGAIAGSLEGKDDKLVKFM